MTKKGCGRGDNFKHKEARQPYKEIMMAGIQQLMIGQVNK